MQTDDDNTIPLGNCIARIENNPIHTTFLDIFI